MRILLLLLALASPPSGATHYNEVLGRPQGAPLLGSVLDRKSKEVASVLRCPVCQGLSVEDSPSGMAQKMRAQVRELVAAGYGEEQVVSYFERSYGEFVRLEPTRQGVNWFVWLAPVAGLVVGAGVIFAMLRRGDRGPAGASTSDDPELAPYLERVREQARRKS